MERADVPVCTRLLASLVRAENIALHAGAYGGPGEDADIERALALFLDRRELGFVWLVEEDTAVVALATVSLAVSTHMGAVVAKVPDLVVRGDARGRGVGAFAVESLGEELRAIGAARIDLGVHENNADARRFYERLGFVANHETGMSLVL
jgi:GNAT superfamily N-acetyltransferase